MASTSVNNKFDFSSNLPNSANLQKEAAFLQQANSQENSPGQFFIYGIGQVTVAPADSQVNPEVQATWNEQMAIITSVMEKATAGNASAEDFDQLISALNELQNLAMNGTTDNCINQEMANALSLLFLEFSQVNIKPGMSTIPRPAESFKKELKIELEEAGVDLPLPFTDQLLLLSASSMKPLQLQSSDLSNHFQQIIGEQFGKEAPLEFEKNIYSLLEELSQLISAEILKLPSSTQTDLMIHSTKTNLEFEKFLDFFSNSVDIVTKPFLSSKEIKVNSSFYI